MVFQWNFLEGEKQEFPAHRVVVASRCDWFRRALLSGMKESIQKYVASSCLKTWHFFLLILIKILAHNILHFVLRFQAHCHT